VKFAIFNKKSAERKPAQMPPEYALPGTGDCHLTCTTVVLHTIKHLVTKLVISIVWIFLIFYISWQSSSCENPFDLECYDILTSEIVNCISNRYEFIITVAETGQFDKKFPADDRPLI
jgi:hypothetical protein